MFPCHTALHMPGVSLFHACSPPNAGDSLNLSNSAFSICAHVPPLSDSFPALSLPFASSHHFLTSSFASAPKHKFMLPLRASLWLISALKRCWHLVTSFCSFRGSSGTRLRFWLSIFGAREHVMPLAFDCLCGCMGSLAALI